MEINVLYIEKKSEKMLDFCHNNNLKQLFVQYLLKTENTVL